MKNFDFKSFLIEKGERVGLWVCVGIMGLLVLSGLYSAITCASPSQTAKEITDEATRINGEMRTGNGPAPPVHKLARPNLQLVSHETVRTRENFFTPNILEDNKRRNPKILEPTEFQVDVMHAVVRDLYITKTTGKAEPDVYVLVPKNAKLQRKLTAAEKRREKILQQQQKYFQMIGSGGEGGDIGYGPGSMPQPDMGDPMDPMGGSPFGTEGGGGKKIEYELKQQKLTDKLYGQKIAEMVHPYRMVMVSASFPYKQQLEEFRRALKQKTNNDLVMQRDFIPRFLGFDIERQTLRPDGTVLDKWKPLRIQDDFKKVLILAASTEPDDVTMQPFIFKGLVMPRPLLARGAYPIPKLERLEETIAEYKKLSTTTTLATKSPFNQRRTGEGYDVFDPLQNLGEFAPNLDGTLPDDPGGMPTPGPGGILTPMPGGTTIPGGLEGSTLPEVWVPEHCLGRFIDVTPKPGFTYQYRIQLRAANPNFGRKELVVSDSLAKIKELTSGWKEVPQKAVLPAEANMYALSKLKNTQIHRGFDPDRTFVEFHNWLEKLQLNPGKRESEFPLGEWVVTQMPAYRGEVIGQLERLEVPMWFPTKVAPDGTVGSYDFAVSPNNPKPWLKSPKGVDIDFNTNTLLVDFEGGALTFNPGRGKIPVKDDAPVEMLLLTPEGKLVVRNSKDDFVNKERKERYDRVTDDVKELKNMKKNANKPANTSPSPGMP